MDRTQYQEYMDSLSHCQSVQEMRAIKKEIASLSDHIIVLNEKLEIAIEKVISPWSEEQHYRTAAYHGMLWSGNGASVKF